MQSNRSRDTKPEPALRSAVHALLLPRSGCRSSVARTADLVFPRARVAVFLDGCFWHGCLEHHTVAAANAKFWPTVEGTGPGPRHRQPAPRRRLGQRAGVGARDPPRRDASKRPFVGERAGATGNQANTAKQDHYEKRTDACPMCRCRLRHL
jgi:DNA mismatch endonuclease (patch repair protein)